MYEKRNGSTEKEKPLKLVNKLKYIRLPLSRIGEGHISAEFQAAVSDKSKKMTVISVKATFFFEGLV